MSATLATLLLSLLAVAVQTQPASKDVVDSLRALMQAQHWEELDTRVASIAADDPAWERLSSIVYSAGIARNDLLGVITRLQRVVETTTRPSNKAAALITIARVHRRQGDGRAAVRVLEQARSAAPESPYAEEAIGLIYEIEHLSPGLTAPAIDAKSRTGQPINLAALRGKAVVLVFWGST
jgi:hypothetical protein